MTHSMMDYEKKKLLRDVEALTASDILQAEDKIEIDKILDKACARVLAVIDGPYPVSSGSAFEKERA